MNNDFTCKHSQKTLVVIDPLVSCAWLDDRSIDCEQWAFSHPEIYNVEIQVIAVFCVSGRWIPVVLTPWGQTVRIASYDANAVLPAALSSCLTQLANALGFVEINFDHSQRTFACKSACGAVAINFLRSQVAGFPRVGTTLSACGRNITAFVRSFFGPCLLLVKSLARGFGVQETMMTTQNVNGRLSRHPLLTMLEPGLPLLKQRPAHQASRLKVGLTHAFQLMTDSDCSVTMAKPWVRMKSGFTCEVLVDQRIHDSTGAFPPKPTVLSFEPLNSLKWDDAGHILTEKWCTAFPKVKAHGHQIVSVAIEGDHWLLFGLSLGPRSRCPYIC